MFNPVLAETKGIFSVSSPIWFSISSFVSPILADGKSILFKTGKISKSCSRARYVLAKVCASTPWLESTTRIAPSQA